MQRVAANPHEIAHHQQGLGRARREAGHPRVGVRVGRRRRGQRLVEGGEGGEKGVIYGRIDVVYMRSSPRPADALARLEARLVICEA